MSFAAPLVSTFLSCEGQRDHEHNAACANDGEVDAIHFDQRPCRLARSYKGRPCCRRQSGCRPGRAPPNRSNYGTLFRGWFDVGAGEPSHSLIRTACSLCSSFLMSAARSSPGGKATARSRTCRENRAKRSPSDVACLWRGPRLIILSSRTPCSKTSSEQGTSS
jgi:hypothetical protein